MSLTRIIFDNLNESAEVKKPYGEKPEEGKKEKLAKGKATKVPKRNDKNEKVKINKLQKDNNQAEDIYPNDTEKVMDMVDSKEQSDKGKIAKQGTIKAERKVKFPFGNKAETPSDNKLIKENKEVKCDGAECKDKQELKEDLGDYSYGAGLLKEIYEYYERSPLGADAFFEDIYDKLDMTNEELEKWYKSCTSDEE